MKNHYEYYKIIYCDLIMCRDICAIIFITELFFFKMKIKKSDIKILTYLKFHSTKN